MSIKEVEGFRKTTVVPNSGSLSLLRKAKGTFLNLESFMDFQLPIFVSTKIRFWVIQHMTVEEVEGFRDTTVVLHCDSLSLLQNAEGKFMNLGVLWSCNYPPPRQQI